MRTEHDHHDPTDAAYRANHRREGEVATTSIGMLLEFVEMIERRYDESPAVELNGAPVPAPELLGHLLVEARPAADTPEERDWAAGVARYLELCLYPSDDGSPMHPPADSYYRAAGRCWARHARSAMPAAVMDALERAAMEQGRPARPDLVRQGVVDTLAQLAPTAAAAPDPASDQQGMEPA